MTVKQLFLKVVNYTVNTAKQYFFWLKNNAAFRTNELILMATGSNFIRYICSKKDTDILNQRVFNRTIVIQGKEKSSHPARKTKWH